MGMAGVKSLARIEFVLNGEPVSVDAGAGEHTLLSVIRGRGLTGAKEGCAEGECGACAVALISEHGPDASSYRIVNSCLMPVALAADHEVHTVESLAEGGRLAPAQEAMAAAGGSQCGYCTPGFVMSLFAEQYRQDRTGPCDPLSLSGNLCRCTGYRPIRDAALSLGPPPPGALRDRLTRPAPRIGGVVVPGFSRPVLVAQCVVLLAAYPDATLVAGGTDLGVDANLKGHRWTHLVSLEAIDELRTCTSTEASVTIGAALPLSDIARHWVDAPDVLRSWLELFSSPLIRNRATLGGNLVTASPIGDAAPLLLALDATVHVAGPSGRRSLPLSEFFTGYRKTAMRPAEILTAVDIPKPLPAFARFYKVAKRRLDDISTLAAAMAMDWDDDGRIRRARFAFGGVAATPVRIVEAEAAVVGRVWDADAVADVQAILARTLTPMSDHRGSKEYRLEVAKSLVEKFWRERTA
jgi:xanthine dehydrogenase small subunit